MNKHKGAPALIGFICVAQLVGCGGGGGGTPAPTLTPPPQQGVPQNPPSPPSISYTGNSSSATLNEATAGQLADLLYDGVFGSIAIADAVASFSLPAPGVIDQVQAGPDGGSAHVTGRVEASFTGWLSFVFTDYRRGDYTYNGQQVFELLRVNNGLQDSLARISLYDLNIHSADRDATYEGVITRRATLAPATQTITGSMLFRVTSAPTAFLAENINLVRTEPAQHPGFELSGTGRLYHDAHGWLDWSLATPWSFRDGESFPSFGGPAVGTDALGRELRVVSLTEELASLQFSSSSPGLLDRTARVTWPLRFAAQINAQTSGAPSADAGASRVVPTQSRVELDGAFSTQPSSPFLRHRWRLLYRPPTSVARLSAETAFNPSITLDQSGRYLLELEVDGGRGIARDWVALTASDTVTTAPQPRAQLVPGQTADVGDFVSIDRGNYALPSFEPTVRKPPNVSVVEPWSGQAIPVSTGDRFTTFTASERGVYQIVMAHDTQLDYEWLAVGSTSIPFLPPVWFSVADFPEDLAVADIDGDGIDDIIVSLPMDPGSERIEIIYNKPPPGVGTRVMLPGGGFAIAAGDLTSDGRVDIAAAFWGGVDLFAQAEDGSFAHSERLTTECFLFTEAGQLQIADINGDGRNDLLKSGCGGDFEYALQSQQGLMGTLQAFQTGLSGGSMIKVGDLSADAIPDVVVYDDSPFDLAGHSVAVVYGSENGFQLPVEVLPYTQSNAMAPGPAIGDLNDDGRAELVFSVYRTFPGPAREIHIYSQGPSGQLVQSTVLAATSQLSGVEIADLNGDARMDLIERPVTPGFGAHLQGADGRFDDRLRAALFTDHNVPAPAEGTGDFNGDGVLDIAFRTHGWSGAAVALLFGREQ